jgi:hypothetical protein
VSGGEIFGHPVRVRATPFAPPLFLVSLYHTPSNEIMQIWLKVVLNRINTGLGKITIMAKKTVF